MSINFQSHGIVWLPDGSRELHHYDAGGQSVGLCDCHGRVTVETNPDDFNNANVVHAPPGFEERAREFWEPSPSTLKGDCVRCRAHKLGVKMFLLTSNPSVTFGAPGGLKTDEVKHAIACKGCLTDEEAAKILAPVAVFVIENLFIRTKQSQPKSDLPRAANYIRAALIHRTGNVGTYERSKEKALEALG